MSYTLQYTGAEIDSILGRSAPGGQLDTDIAAKAPLASPALTGDPTAPTQDENDNSTKLATTAYADRAAADAASAAYPTDSVSGDVVSFADGADGIPVKAFTGSIIPQQNLHGQSAPYPAGGGKNKLPFPYASTTKTTNGITFSDKGDGTITINGTSTGNADFTLVNSLQLPSGNYTFSIENIPNGAYVAKSAGGGTAYANIYSYSFPYTLEITDNSAIEYIILRIPVGITVSNVTVKPMIRLASVSDATFAPYSNICPISGWTGANITRAGVNLWDESWEVGGIIWATGADVAANDRIRTGFIKVTPSSTFYAYVSPTLSAFTKGGVVYYDENKNWVSYTNEQTFNAVYTAPADAAFMRFVFQGLTTYTTGISINQPSSYTGYNDGAEVITLDFGQTVYAGTLTALGGGLWQVQPTHKKLTLSSSDSWAYSSATGTFYVGINDPGLLMEPYTSAFDGICDRFAPHPNNGAWNAADYIGYLGTARGVRVSCASAAGDVATFKGIVDGAVVLHPLATLPDPIIVTAEDLETLLGANTVWTDVGSVTGMTYRADTALYIDKKLGA